MAIVSSRPPSLLRRCCKHCGLCQRSRHLLDISIKFGAIAAMLKTMTRSCMPHVSVRCECTKGLCSQHKMRRHRGDRSNLARVQQAALGLFTSSELAIEPARKLLSGEGQHETQIIYRDEQCAEGYWGRLCSLCKTGYGASGEHLVNWFIIALTPFGLYARVWVRTICPLSKTLTQHIFCVFFCCFCVHTVHYTLNLYFVDGKQFE